jgi:hypothetical protein
VRERRPNYKMLTMSADSFAFAIVAWLTAIGSLVTTFVVRFGSVRGGSSRQP